MNTVKPTISVIMGTLYRKDSIDFLKRSIDSILAQSLGDFEFIICDDGSTEAAISYLESTAISDPRIKLVRGAKQTDLATKLNYCLYFAQGEYIARMDDDDYSEPYRFEKQVLFLEQNPNIGFVGSNVSLYRDGNISGERILPEYPAKRDFLFTQPFVHPALMFRTEILKNVNGYSELPRCVRCEDYDLLMRLYKEGVSGANIQENLLTYTIPPKNSKRIPMKYRVNEMKTRYVNFKALGMLPGAVLYVVKPIVVGLLPVKLLTILKKQ